MTQEGAFDKLREPVRVRIARQRNWHARHPFQTRLWWYVEDHVALYRSCELRVPVSNEPAQAKSHTQRRLATVATLPP